MQDTSNNSQLCDVSGNGYGGARCLPDTATSECLAAGGRKKSRMTIQEKNKIRTVDSCPLNQSPWFHNPSGNEACLHCSVKCLPDSVTSRYSCSGVRKISQMPVYECKKICVRKKGVSTNQSQSSELSVYSLNHHEACLHRSVKYTPDFVNITWGVSGSTQMPVDENQKICVRKKGASTFPMNQSQSGEVGASSMNLVQYSHVDDLIGDDLNCSVQYFKASVFSIPEMSVQEKANISARKKDASVSPSERYLQSDSLSKSEYCFLFLPESINDELGGTVSFQVERMIESDSLNHQLQLYDFSRPETCLHCSLKFLPRHLSFGDCKKLEMSVEKRSTIRVRKKLGTSTPNKRSQLTQNSLFGCSHHSNIPIAGFMISEHWTGSGDKKSEVSGRSVKVSHVQRLITMHVWGCTNFDCLQSQSLLKCPWVHISSGSLLQTHTLESQYRLIKSYSIHV